MVEGKSQHRKASHRENQYRRASLRERQESEDRKDQNKNISRGKFGETFNSII